MYPKKCDLCGCMIESADDLDWHGYGNCVEITDEMMAEWEREAKAESCPVCGSIFHAHCSKGCAICDDPNNPHPRYASRFCPGCKRSLCADCFNDHTCDLTTEEL